MTEASSVFADAPVVADITAVAFDKYEVVRANGLASGCLQFSTLPVEKDDADNDCYIILHEHLSKVTSLSFASRDTRVFLAASYENELLCLYENEAGRWQSTFKDRKEGLVAVSFSEDGHLAVACRDRVEIYALPDGDSHDLQHKDTINDNLEPDDENAFITFYSNRKFAVLTRHGWLRIYSSDGVSFTDAPQCIRVFLGSDERLAPKPLAVSGWCDDREKIAVAYRDNHVKEDVVRIIDVDTLEAKEIWDKEWDGQIVALSWRGRGRELVITKAIVLHSVSVAYIQRPDETWIPSKKMHSK